MFLLVPVSANGLGISRGFTVFSNKCSLFVFFKTYVRTLTYFILMYVSYTWNVPCPFSCSLFTVIVLYYQCIVWLWICEHWAEITTRLDIWQCCIPFPFVHCIAAFLICLMTVERNIRLWRAYFILRNVYVRIMWRRNVVVSALASINVVNRHWGRLLLGWVTGTDCLRAGKMSGCVTSHLGRLRLSLLPSAGW